MASATMTSPVRAPARADLGAWLAVAAGTLGALMATLDISIVNSALPTIQGEIGASGTEGTWITTARTIIAQRLPREQQPIGIAAFGVTAILGPVLGPLVRGWLTENISWHYAFFINVPISAVLITLLLVGLLHEKTKPHLFAQADWLGIARLALGLGRLTVFLEDGQREQWFSFELIRWMAVVSATGFGLLFLGQATARRPIIKLKLLLDRQFGAVALMGVVLGIVLYGTSYAIPQFLSALAGISVIQEQRTWLHSRRIEKSLHANGPAVQDYVAGLAQTAGDRTEGLRLLSQQLGAQALTMTYNDIFWIMGVGTLAVLPLVLFLRPLPKGAEPAMVH